VEKKGRTKEELHMVIEWLTGFGNKKLQDLLNENVTFETFFQHASINPRAHLIKGVICGYRAEEIEDPLTQQVRYLDKFVMGVATGHPTLLPPAFDRHSRLQPTNSSTGLFHRTAKNTCINE
jgi:hypothetical protein